MAAESIVGGASQEKAQERRGSPKKEDISNLNSLETRHFRKEMSNIDIIRLRTYPPNRCYEQRGNRAWLPHNGDAFSQGCSGKPPAIVTWYSG